MNISLLFISLNTLLINIVYLLKDISLAFKSSYTLTPPPLLIINFKLNLIQILLLFIINPNLYYFSKLTFIKIFIKSLPTITPILH